MGMNCGVLFFSKRERKRSFEASGNSGLMRKHFA
jgi:hypothetical protein